MFASLDKIRRRLKSKALLIYNFYPPYLGAGIRMTHIANDLRTVKVRMGLTRLNKNYVGTQFGGSLYSMCDPFFMLILMHNLGPDYIVWDKAASILFLRPGRGTVHTTFHIPETRIEAIRREVDEQGKAEPRFKAEIRDTEDKLIARVEKTLFVKLGANRGQDYTHHI